VIVIFGAGQNRNINLIHQSAKIMRKIAFIVLLLGLFILLLYLNLSKPIELISPENLTSLEENQKVMVSGMVAEERATSNYIILTLDNKIELYCSCSNIPELKGKNISALGIIDTFQKTKIKVLRLQWY